ncbi:MAG: hypothetical protein ACOYYS_05280 [Chloroflexota bacterium]
MWKSPVAQFLAVLVAILLFVSLGPEEKSLGSNVRIVYLHGAWVLTALAAFLVSGGTGLAALFTRRERYHYLSRTLGYTGLVFWVTYLPLSLWAMQANWNGLFLAEPRMRTAFVFAVTGLLLQAGLALLDRPALVSAANVAYIAVLLFVLSRVDSVMHPPPSPIFNSGNALLQFYFIALNLLTWAAALQVARWLHGCGTKAAV